jgi:hypothetical protein
MNLQVPEKRLSTFKEGLCSMELVTSKQHEEPNKADGTEVQAHAKSLVLGEKFSSRLTS